MDNLELNLRTKYLNNLLNACIKQNIDPNIINIELDKLKNPELENCTISATDVNIEKNNSEVYSIDYLYLKPWTKLTQTHKIIKIKEFINNLEIINSVEKEELKDQLIELLKDKKVKNKITYDEIKGKIISVSSLTFENEKYCIKKE
jgi:ribosome-binding factor A